MFDSGRGLWSLARRPTISAARIHSASERLRNLVQRPSDDVCRGDTLDIEAWRVARKIFRVEATSLLDYHTCERIHMQLQLERSRLSEIR